MNPNIPWKTRGNGAIALQVGIGNGEKIKIGEIDGKDVFSSKLLRQEPNGKEYTEIRKIVKKTIEENAKTDDENTNPGFVLLNKQPELNVYRNTVRQIVSLDKIKSLLNNLKADFQGYKNCRGLIGATSAIAWVPIKDKTFELISYRQQKNWGTKRDVNEESVQKMDNSCKTTFDNYDYKNKHNRLVPNSPCPILYGVRGDAIEELMRAFSIVRSESVDSWILFETNQGTDDHLQRKIISNIQRYESVIVEGSVVKSPYTIEGGHVIFTIKDATGTIDCAAYEPTKEFRNIVRELQMGDIVEVYGGVRKKPLTINVEKINIKYLTKIVEKIENPICPNCGKHMKSKGSNQGFKCKICGRKSDEPLIREKKRLIHIGFYEVPVCARRHLSKPLKRIK